MPELPEVETVKNGLREILQGQSFNSIWQGKKPLRFAWPGQLKKILNQPIENIHRRAKYILIDVGPCTFLSHLGMTGSWRFENKFSPQAHDHLVLGLSKGGFLLYRDPRRFGYVDVLQKESLSQSRWFSQLGPEPLDKNKFNAEYLFRVTRNKTSSIKNILMDQKIVVGVGNIYVAEALFLSGLRPQKPGRALTRAKAKQLVLSIQKILTQSINAGGTTIRDFRQAGGSQGYFQQKLFVYGRESEPCRKCQTLIKNLSLGGRSSFYCPKCQG